MIALQKGPKPQVLVDNDANWTKSLCDKLANGEIPTPAEKTRYRHPRVKAALVAETHGKCAYCESPLLHIHHGDVEHVQPKSLDPALTFEWSNLTLACEKCNQNKSDKDPDVEHIIDPYNDDPAIHLRFSGPLVFPLGTDLGTCTRTLLDLNRGELVEQRKERLEKLLLIIDSALRPKLPAVVKQAIVDDLRREASSASSPYSAMGACLLTTVAGLV